MQNRRSNSAESFKLLQLTDDSQSLSDLELPEIVIQRKRKVRRKIRSKSGQRHDQPTDNLNVTCRYVSIWMCISLSCAWLFLLSYMIAIVHSEYRELAKDVKKLSAISLNVPDALQKWHESSKSLEQNQTAISQKIFEIQQRIEIFEREFTQMKETIHKKEEGTESDKAVNLKDTVAGFGAKIEALRIDVQSLKERYSDIQTVQKSEKLRLDTVKNKIDVATNSSQSTLNTGLQNETLSWVKNITDHCSTELKNVSAQLAAMNDTFSQKINSLDDEMHEHKTKLDGLNVSFANVSSHVTSIESEWPKFKQSIQRLDADTVKMSSDIASLKNNVMNLTTTVNDIQTGMTMNTQRNTLYSDGESRKIDADTTATAKITQNVPLFDIKDTSITNSNQQIGANDSKVTTFPSEIMNEHPVTNSTITTPQSNTTQPIQSVTNAVSQPNTVTTAPSTAPIVMAN